MLTYYNVGQSAKKEKKRRGGEGGLCEYRETTEINRAEKNSGKKSARLRVNGFCC